MHSQPSHPELDQAIDPLASIFHQTADDYDTYLTGEYQSNFHTRQLEWQAHYKRMRAAFSHTILHLIESKHRKRGEMNVAIVGPGLHPIGCDFDERIIDDHLSEMRHVVVTDFSTKVIRTAIRQLIDAGVPYSKLHGFQFDITNGLSTVSEDMIKKMFSNIETEERFYDAAERLSKVEISDLDNCLNEAMDERGKYHAPYLDPFFSGGINEKRTWALTAGPEELPLDVVSFQMVTAGTGAAAEGLIWERLHEVTSDTDRGARVVSEDTMNCRRQAIEHIFAYISRFNTTITKRILRGILLDNPDATCLVITDVSTILRIPRFGEMQRMNIQELRGSLLRPTAAANPSIRVIAPAVQWEWKDEPEHSHGVIALECTRVEAETNGDSQSKDSA